MARPSARQRYDLTGHFRGRTHGDAIERTAERTREADPHTRARKLRELAEERRRLARDLDWYD